MTEKVKYKDATKTPSNDYESLNLTDMLKKYEAQGSFEVFNKAIYVEQKEIETKKGPAQLLIFEQDGKKFSMIPPGLLKWFMKENEVVIGDAIDLTYKGKKMNKSGNETHQFDFKKFVII